MPDDTALITATRLQYRVGHGGFHATIVNDPQAVDDGLVYVYDVGAAPSRPLLRSAIASFVTDLGHRKLNRVHFVILSHIDEDHVNGIDELLTALKNAHVQVGEVILPWLSGAEKLLTKSRSPRRGSRAVVTRLAGTDDDARSYLQGLGAERVRFILPGGEGTPDVPNATDVVREGSLVARQRTSWKLIAVRIDPPEDALLAFVADLQTRVKRLDPKKVSHHSALLTTHRRQIRAAMRSKGVRKALGTAKIGPSLTNWSSISIYGGATTGQACPPLTLVPGDLSMDCTHGWLHTGDLPLNVRSVWRGFERKWNRHLGHHRVCVLTAPHHGSTHSHQSDLYRRFTPGTVLITSGRTRTGKVSRLINTRRAITAAGKHGASVTELNNP